MSAMIECRQAHDADAEAIAELCDQLCYPSTVLEIRSQLEKVFDKALRGGPGS